jgi:protein N-terminal glutamine amidohydrolase
MANHAYTAFFCEENIWHLARKLMAEGVAAEQLTVLVLTNGSRQLPLCAQRTGQEEDGLVLWDYHVILHQRTESGSLVFDFDSRLPFPCGFEQYQAITFPDPWRLPEAWQIRVRILPAATWVRDFRSDRSHMRNAAGNPLHPFPAWPAIGPPPGQGIDLQHYLDLGRELGDVGCWCEPQELAAALARERSTERFSEAGQRASLAGGGISSLT